MSKASLPKATDSKPARSPPHGSPAKGVVFDSWAWLEVLKGTAAGARLRHYVDKGQVTTSALAVTEVVGHFWRHGIGWQDADSMVAVMRANSRVHPVDEEVAALAAQLIVALRQRAKEASYADAVMLATARTLGVALISNDKAFAGAPDVRAT